MCRLMTIKSHLAAKKSAIWIQMNSTSNEPFRWLNTRQLFLADKAAAIHLDTCGSIHSSVLFRFQLCFANFQPIRGRVWFPLTLMIPPGCVFRRAMRETREAHQRVLLKNGKEDVGSAKQPGDPVIREERSQTAVQYQQQC